MFTFKHCFGRCYWHSAALLNLSTLTPLVLSYGCLCPASSSSSSSSSASPMSPSCLRATLAAAPALLEGPCEPSGPVTSHQCRAGMRRGLGPGWGHHSGGGGGALVVVAGGAGARLGRGGKIMLMSCPRHPLWLGGHGHWGTERASGCASPEVTVPDQNHTELLLIKWLSVHPVVSQHYTTTNPLPLHKKTPVKRYRLAIETATLPLYLLLLLPATVNKYGTWYWRCSIPSPFPSPLLVERSPLHTKQSITDSLISNYAL